VESRLSVQGKTTEVIQHGRGLLQGSSLSPSLYALYIDDLSTALQTQKRGSLHNLPIAALLYADDIALVADDEAHLQALLTTCELHANWYHYKFAPKKCLIVSDPLQETPQVKLHGTMLKQTSSFSYLGIPFTHKGIDGTTHALSLAQNALSSMNFFRSVGVNGRGFPVTARMSILRTFLRPKLEYGICLLQRQQMDPIVMAWNKLLRLSFSTPECTSTKAIQAISGLPSMETRHRVLLTKWLLRARSATPDKAIFHAYRQHHTKPHRSSPFRLTAREPLLSAFTGQEHPSLQLKQRIRRITDEERQSAWMDRNVQPWAHERRSTLQIQRKLDGMLDRRASHAVCRWMMGRPFSKPITCKKCKSAMTSVEHVQICTSSDINRHIRNLDLAAAASGIKVILEDCLHLEVRWVARVREPP
jgi:hypothetical protein